MSRKLNGLSLFSGIGGFDIAMDKAGINLVGMCEIDKHAQNVLRRHFGDVPLYDDVRKVGISTHGKGTVDIICGGFPCQDLSVAGKRAGLAGERSGLWYEFARIIDELEPGWVVIENVPGLLSSDRGRDFAIVLRWLVERGYGVSWRILDAQYFGVPQRRRRVFVVASFGNGSSAEILFESEGLPRNPKEISTKGEAAAGTFTIRSGKDGGGKGFLGSDELAMALSGQQQWAYSLREDATKNNFSATPLEVANALSALQPSTQSHHAQTFVVDAYNVQTNDDKRKDRPNGGMYVTDADVTPTLQTGQAKSQTLIVNCLTRSDYKGVSNQYVDDHKLVVQPEIAHTLRANAKQSLMSGDGVINETLVFTPGNLMRGAGPGPSDSTSPTLGANTQGDQFPVVWQNRQQSGEVRIQDDTMPTMTKSWGTGGNNVPMVGVRRLTPTECERLQGFPDGWTDGQADTSRYKQLGNAVAVPVVQWIVDRISNHVL